MAADLEHSAILEDVKQLMALPGSPYYRFGVVIHCGGKDIVPYQVLRNDIERDYRKGCMDANTLVVTLGSGTVMNMISPFQDDITITIMKTVLSSSGAESTTLGIASKMYRGYIADHLPAAAESGTNPTAGDVETGDRSSVIHVCFQIEEIAMEQLRKQQVGVLAKAAPPYVVMQTLLVNACKALKLDTAEVISSFDMEPPNSLMPRAHVMIPDGTPILEVPDLIQNSQGGIYSTGLGFYIQNRVVYTWPMYDTQRQATAKRVLIVLLAPNKYSTMVDTTWRLEDRALTIYSAGISKVVDESLDNLNTKGNGVRFADAAKLVDGFMKVANNKMVASRGANNSEFATTVVGNGQHYTPVSGAKITSNPYLESSKLAASGVAMLLVPWRRSNPDAITPGMAAEVLYDYAGDIRTIMGTVVHAVHSYGLEGRGMTADRLTATTSIMIAIDRNDPAYISYMKAGGQVSPTPNMGSM